MKWWLWLLEKWRAFRKPLSLGQRGERAAERFLKRLGYLILAKGDRSKLGEIDLVAVDPRGVHGRTLVFVEVKTRSTQDAGHPADAVDLHKQRRLTRAAQGYIKRHQLHETPARFDVIAITWPASQQAPHIEHFCHAFEATD
jgi:putative endonuclease